MMTARTWIVIALGIAAAIAAGCSRDDEDPSAARDKIASGEAIYASMCKSCHGGRGEGGKGPVLRDIYKRYDEPSLVRFIDERMPLGEPDKCNGTCPEDVGAYVFNVLRGPIVCEGPALTSRGLRLLTKREYLATVRDLFGAPPPSATPAAPCGTTTFAFDPKGRTLKTVHVAGSFNGWPSTIAAGGWPLALQGNGTWSATRTVPAGSHQYKLVLDESEWIVDPSNAKTASNGLGGENSVLDVTCDAGGGGAAGTLAIDPTSAFPPDTRPEGFPFDDNGPGRVVTSELMGEHFRAATLLAKNAPLDKLVTCDRTQRDACTDTFVRAFGKRAFRRPLSDVEIARYRGVAKTAGDFDGGARAAIRAMLVSPSFAYRSEIGERQADGTYRLTPWETASALSYFFWGTMPDDALLDAAEKGELATPEGIEKQARRLLESPRARTMVATFAEQWLGVESLDQLTKAEDRFPFPAAVRDAMREETRRFVTHVVFDGSHTVDELFTADYTFANEALAKHYGLPGPSGADMQKVKLEGGVRSGLLGHGSILSTTGHSDQSSPIRRGLFVRRRLLCQEFAPPPPNAGGVPKVDPNATTRERFAQHTANAFCKSCHQYIDDVGFGFERFDTVGRFRDTEAGKPIDARGDMNDVEGLGKGTHAPYTNLRELGAVLASSASAKTCVTRQVWRFAHGQLDDDVCAVRPVEQRFLEKGGDLRELLVAVVTDRGFFQRREAVKP